MNSFCSKVSVVLFLFAGLKGAWALPVEAVQRSIQQRWAAANGGNNCTFPQRSDGSDPGLYPPDGFYGSDLNDPAKVNSLVGDIESKVFNYLAPSYVTFSDLEGSQLGIQYNYWGGDYSFSPDSSQKVSAIISPAPSGSAVETRLRQCEQALLLCQRTAFWIVPYTALDKGSTAYTYGVDCYTPPPCGSSYQAAVDLWSAASWNPINVIYSTQIFGETASAGIYGGLSGSCYYDQVNLFTRTGQISANKGDSPGQLSFYVAVSIFGSQSLASCPVAADYNWHVIDQVAGNGTVSSRYIPVDPAVNSPPPALPGCSDGGWFVYVCAGLFRGQFTDSWNQTSYAKENDKKFGGDQCDDPGMARYSVHAMLASLNVKDTPLRYSSPLGPTVDFTASYNQRDNRLPTAASYSNLGAQWTFNWLSYVADDPNTQSAATAAYLPGGGSESFRYDSGLQAFLPDPQSHALLVRISSNTYERRLPDGSKQVFGPQSSGSQTYPRLLFITQWVDPAGNVVTVNYDASNRVTSVADALGQGITFDYQVPGDNFKISKITDSFGRFAVLNYTNGQLTSIIDPVGIQS